VDAAAGHLRTFGLSLQEGIPGLEQAVHVAAQEESIREPPERPERRGVVPVVGHERPSRDGEESVDMAEAPEWAGDLFVRESRGSFDDRDPAGEGPPDAEMAGAPGHGLSGLDRATHPTRDGMLAAGGHRGRVEADVARQVEDVVDRGRDLGLERESRHPRTSSNAASIAG
jgi:hypothetical protein